jgi:hypothetical protein
MAKLARLLITLLLIEMALIIFLGASTPASQLLTLVTTPNVWSSASLVEYVLGISLGLGLGVAIIGTLWSGHTELIFGGIVAVFLTYGALIGSLYIEMVKTFPDNRFIPILTVGPIAILYVYSLLKFWRGND